MLDTIMFMNACDLCNTREICSKTVEKNPMMLRFVPNHFKTQEICERFSCERFSYALPYVPDEYKTQQLYESVGLKYPENLRFLLNQYKTQEMSEWAVKKFSYHCHIFICSW